MENTRWFEVSNVHEVPSPALLVYPHRITENISRMIEIAGDAGRLRPHIKTHKMAEVLQIQDSLGITRCKCSTIAEAELAAMNGVEDILLAMQPVGPNIRRLFELIRAFPFSKFSAITDSESIITAISQAATGYNSGIRLFLDINTGMNRTGVLPDAGAVNLYKKFFELPMLKAGGLHAYDGHIHDYLPADRKIICEKEFEKVSHLKSMLEKSGFPVPTVITGGSPTFPMHAQAAKNTELSPGTTVLWDYGYSQQYPDLNFLYAALVLTRVVSKPGNNKICLDLGHKALAAEMPQPRVKLIGLGEYTILNHSEEHMVLESPLAGTIRPGDVFYGIPWHICPTVARYNRAVAIRDNKAVEEWTISRDWKINI